LQFTERQPALVADATGAAGLLAIDFGAAGASVRHDQVLDASNALSHEKGAQVVLPTNFGPPA
jgi:hypothetical protein